MKKSIALLLAGMMTLSLAACGESAAETTVSEPAETAAEASAETADASTADKAGEAVGLANPWSDISEEEAKEIVPNLFKAPEGAANVKWSVMTSEESPMVQMTFDLDGSSFTAREQMTGDEAKDISGMFYEWTVQDDVQFTTWGDGNMTGKTYRYVGDSEFADLCTWYDVETGASYSLSVVAPDLDGFDIVGVVEGMYDPANHAGAQIPEDEEHVSMDITGCDTFTQIVDKLPAGTGYANASIDGTDVLLVASGVFEFEGHFEAIDADVYYYNEDGAPTYAGYVTAGGTAYPLAVGKDGKLYVGGNHFMKKMTLVAGGMVNDEEAYVVYDTNGNGTYFYRSDVKDVESDENAQVKDDTVLNGFFDDYMEKTDIIEFNKVQ
ncbi:MAG: hypothetical protein IJ695_09430 [Butyrivibrio sp.]|nr:hypothetical protein [Butyrivibrio sp.]